MEAKNLISYMDDNRDGMLSMEEIMKHKDIFISSKVMNFAANVHDEFWLHNGRIVKKMEGLHVIRAVKDKCKVYIHVFNGTDVVFRRGKKFKL